MISIDDVANMVAWLNQNGYPILAAGVDDALSGRPSPAADALEAAATEAQRLREAHEAARANFHTMQLAANELRKKLEAAEAEIERMTPRFVAYDYLESPARADMAETEIQRLREALKDVAGMVPVFARADSGIYARAIRALPNQQEGTK